MKRLALFLLLLAWPALFVGATVEESVRCGWHRGIWEDVACKSPDKPRAYAMMASTYLERGEWDLAIIYAELAEERASGRSDPYSQMVGAVSLANAAYARLQRAETVNCASFTDDVGMVGAFSASRKQCFDLLLEEYQSIDRLLERARNEYAPDHLVLNNSVQLFLKTGRIERALNLADAALKQFPDSGALMWSRGDVAAELGDCEGQLEWIRKSQAVNPLARYTVRSCIEK